VVTELSRTNYLEWVGRPLGTGKPRRIEQSDVDQFARLSGDEQWIHVDPVRAQASPFGATLVHGLFVLSLIPSWISDVARVVDAESLLAVGYDEVRFLSPVCVPSTLKARVGLTRAQDGGQRLRTWWGVEVIDEHDDLVATATAIAQW
jgi:acyl dehydratase